MHKFSINTSYSCVLKTLWLAQTPSLPSKLISYTQLFPCKSVHAESENSVWKCTHSHDTCKCICFCRDNALHALFVVVLCVCVAPPRHPPLPNMTLPALCTNPAHLLCVSQHNTHINDHGGGRGILKWRPINKMMLWTKTGNAGQIRQFVWTWTDEHLSVEDSDDVHTRYQFKNIFIVWVRQLHWHNS